MFTSASNGRSSFSLSNCCCIVVGIARSIFSDLGSALLSGIYSFVKGLRFLVPGVLEYKTFCYAPCSGMPEKLAYNSQPKFYCSGKPFACDQFTINYYPGTICCIIQLAHGDGGVSNGFFVLLSKRSVSFTVFSKYKKLRSTACSILP